MSAQSFTLGSGVTFVAPVTFTKSSAVVFVAPVSFTKSSAVVFVAPVTIPLSSAVKFVHAAPFRKNSDVSFIAPVQFTLESTVKFRQPTSRIGYYVDSGVIRSYGTSPFVGNTWPVFWHLEGETIQVMQDGVYLGEFLVANGSVTLPAPVSGEMIGGLKITSVLHTLSPEGGSPVGTSQGKAKRVDKLDIRVYGSVGCKHGSDLDALTRQTFDEDAAFSGDVRIDLEQSYGTDASYYITEDRPTPLVILSLMPHLSTQE